MDPKIKQSKLNKQKFPKNTQVKRIRSRPPIKDHISLKQKKDLFLPEMPRCDDGAAEDSFLKSTPPFPRFCFTTSSFGDAKHEKHPIRRRTLINSLQNPQIGARPAAQRNARPIATQTHETSEIDQITSLR